MDRAGAEAIPTRPTSARTAGAPPASRFSRVVTSLIGLDAKMRQYEQGEQFIASVEGAGGPDLFARVWRALNGAQPAEIREPDRWITRRVGPRSPWHLSRRRHPANCRHLGGSEWQDPVCCAGGRCSFPARRSGDRRSVGGADSLALLVLAIEAGCEVTAVHVDHGLRTARRPRPRWWPPPRRALAPPSAPCGCYRAWTDLEGRAASPATPPCLPGCSPGTRPMTRPRRCCSTSSGGGPAGLAGCHRAPAAPVRPCAG